MYFSLKQFSHLYYFLELKTLFEENLNHEVGPSTESHIKMQPQDSKITFENTWANLTFIFL